MEYLSMLVILLLVILFPTFRGVYFRKRERKEIPDLSRRQIFFDVIKGIAIIAVVLIHATYYFLEDLGLNNNYFFLDLVNNLARFTIPVFFICSGVLLKPVVGKKALEDFYKRKLVRILIPYVLMTGILFILHPGSIWSLLYKFISGTASLPYYFVIVLLQMYILFPFLSQIRTRRYFLIGSFLVSVLYQLSPLTSYPFGIIIFPKFLFFFSYGMYFREYYLDYKKESKEIYVWSLIVLAYVLSIFAFQGFYLNTRYFYGIAIFNVLYYFRDTILGWRWIRNFLASFGSNSLWIFLIHYELMSLIYGLFSDLGWNYYVIFAVFFMLSLMVSYTVALLCAWLYKIGSNKLNLKRI